MTDPSTVSLLEPLRELSLLDAEQFAEIERDLGRRFPDPQALARELLQRGWLTAYQLDQLFQGRGKELRLGSYVLLDRIGEGGMGAVYKARHRKMDRLVALKVIRKELLAKPEAVKRFEREVRAAARLTHPNIVAAYDAGQAGDTHFFAMEYVEGIDLHKRVSEKGPLAAAQACDCIRQAGARSGARPGAGSGASRHQAA